MSSHRRNNLTSSFTTSSGPQSMSGAEMLVLQQSVKQYILTRQTRGLTDHELEEFEKLRSRLLPSLQRYSQSQSQSTPTNSTQVTSLGGGAGSGLLLPQNGTADISKRTSTSASQQGRLTNSRQQQQRPARQSTTKTPSLYPTTTSSGRPVSASAQKQPRIPAPLSVTSSQSTPVVPSKPARQPLGNRAISQNTSSTILHAESSTTTTAAPNASRGSLVSNTGAKGDKKRPKGFTIFQDKENTPSKRRRLKGQTGHESDSDKENQDPLAVPVATTNITPRKATVLGEKTNFINNVLNTSVGIMKGKEVLRDIVASKIVDMAATAPLAIPKATKSKQQQEQQQQKQQKQQQQTRLYPTSAPATTASIATAEKLGGMQTASTQKSTKPDVQRRAIQDDKAPCVTSRSRDSVVEEIHSATAVAQPDKGVSHGRLLLNIKQEPADAVKLELGATVEWTVETGSSAEQDIVRVPETPPRNSAVVPETPPRKTSGIVQQIPASVEEEGSTGSFERYIKVEHADKKLGSRKPIIDFFEIPCSEASQESIESASLEETCPMPEFLLEGLPEDPQHDEAEVTLVDTVNRRQINHRLSFAASPCPGESVSQSSRRNSTLASTTFADGLWCIEDMKYQVVETVCGFRERWLALEAIDHVQFWRLDDDTPSLKSQWVRYIHLPKSSSRSTQVLFAPDDSFAVVMDGLECSYTKVPLQDLDYLRQSDLEFPKYSWTSFKPSAGFKGFIAVQDSGGDYMIVAATEEAGSIGFISVPNDDDKTGAREVLKVKSVTVDGADESMSSLAMVGNTTLVAATFGPLVAIWDVNSLEEPVMVLDTSGLSLTNPLLVYAAVPIQFFEDERMFGTDRSHPATWPILATFRDSGHSNQCALYAMKDGHIERIHQYHGSSEISSAHASSRFIACQVKANGRDVLQLWDISKPEPAIQLSLLEPPSLADVVTQRGIQQQSLWHQQAVPNIKKEEDKAEGEENLDYLLSSASTLSSPPDDLSSSPFPSIETEREATLPSCLPVRTPSPVRGRPIVNVGGIRQRSCSQNQPGRASCLPADWIDLTSIAIMERKEILFSIHPSQQWIVVAQKSSMMNSPSVVHILDLMSILYPSSAIPSS